MKRWPAEHALHILWRSEVSTVTQAEGLLTAPAGERRLACDVLFVPIGAVPARSVLATLGLDSARPAKLP